MRVFFNDWQFGKRVLDHRGRPATMRNSTGWSFNDSDRLDFHKYDWGQKITQKYLLFGALVGLVVSVSATALFVAGSLWMVVVVSSFAAVVLGLMMQMVAYQPMLRWYVDRRLARGECGACEFHLEDILPDPDGCTLCPECGAAWKLSQPSVEVP